MTKFIPYLVIALLIVGAAIVVSGKLKNQPSYQTADIQQEEQLPVSETKLETKAAVDSAIETELEQLDKELQGVSEADFNASELSNTQLGL